MSLGFKLLTGFPAVVGASTFPLVVAIKNKEMKVENYPEVAPPSEPVVNFSPIEELKKEGHDGCLQLQGRGRHVSLYACLKNVKEDLQTTFYHFDKYARSPNKKINQIISINYVTSFAVTMKLKGVSRSKPLKFPPFWMDKWPKRQEIKPETQCKFSKDNGVRDKITYTFICNDKEIQKEIKF